MAGRMKRFLKALLPVSTRVAIKRVGHALHDLVDPIKDPRIPPRRDTLIGGGDFAKVGESFRARFQQYGLTPEMEVLDVGCGQGRMARPLVGALDGGSYTGFDIERSGVEWCREKYADVPNFTFDHADVFNARYNPDGAVAAKDYIFPYAENRFDFVFLTSVFTHMFAEDVENYLSEIARVLKPGGKAIITWFLWDEAPKLNPIMDFHAEVDTVSRTTLPENPEAALAFNRDWVEGLYSRLGLEIETVELGGWRESVLDGSIQDLIVGVRA